jgi:hypothetical protein
MFTLSYVRNAAGVITTTWIHALGHGYAVCCAGQVTRDQIDTVDALGVVFRATVDEDEPAPAALDESASEANRAHNLAVLFAD